MRRAAAAVMIAFSAVYLIYGLRYPMWESGQVGAGFFPRILGGSLLLLSLVNAAKEFRSADRDAVATPRDGIIALALTGAFMVSVPLLGSFLAMLVYTLLFLGYFRRGRLVSNAAISVLLALAVEVSFRALNAPLPRGAVDLVGMVW